MLTRLQSLAEFFRRFVALSSAGVVLALAIFAASPNLHEELHEADHADQHGDSCAVVLFAEGVSLLSDAVEAPAPSCAPDATIAARSKEICLVATRYLHPPERGPPAMQKNV